MFLGRPDEIELDDLGIEVDTSTDRRVVAAIVLSPSGAAVVSMLPVVNELVC